LATDMEYSANGWACGALRSIHPEHRADARRCQECEEASGLGAPKPQETHDPTQPAV